MDDPFATTATVKVCFLIYTHDLDTTLISNLLELQPSNVKPYQPLINSDNRKANATSWIIETPEEISHDINDQLSQLILLLADKKEIIISLKKQYNTSHEFRIIIKMKNEDKCGLKPAKGFDHKTLAFINDIYAEIMFDQYII